MAPKQKNSKSTRDSLFRAAGIATLYAEELKATMRGRFAWLGAAVILVAIVSDLSSKARPALNESALAKPRI